MTYPICRSARSVPLALDFRRFFAYAGIVPSTCQVSFEDGAGVTHTVSVAVSSLYEAAALAMPSSNGAASPWRSLGPRRA
jgi:hypothetical protein